MAERHRGRIAAMLAADAELEVAPHLASALGGDAHERADAGAVEGDERIGGENAARGVDAEEARRIVPADAERGLGEIVGAEREELRRLGDLVRDERRA